MKNKNILKDAFQLNSSVASTEKQTPLFKGILYERIDDGFGNPLLKKVDENTVVVGGAINALEHITNVSANWKPSTLNSIYNINPSVASDNMKSSIALFGAGNGGSGLDFGSVVAKDIKSRDIPGLLPMRTGTDVDGEEETKYFLKKDNGDNTYNWYLKEFGSAIIIKTCWKDSTDDDTDGTEITEEIYNSTRTEGIESFAEFVLDFNTKDIREYYESIGSLDTARYNSIGLYMGQKVQLADGSYDYCNVRLFSYLNIDNKSVRIKTASQYVYRIYALV